MAYIPPPLPLSIEELTRRIESGAKTLEEIDPEFWKWKKRRDFSHKAQAIILSTGALILFLTLVMGLKI